MLNAIQAKILDSVQHNDSTLAQTPRRVGKSYLIRYLAKEFSILHFSGLNQLNVTRFGDLNKPSLVIIEEPDFVCHSRIIEVLNILKACPDTGSCKLLIIGTPEGNNGFPELFRYGKQQGWNCLSGENKESVKTLSSL